jgi:general stress protein YciG
MGGNKSPPNRALEVAKEEMNYMIIRQGTGRARGLAAMSPEKRKEIASKGGRTSQARGTAHQWTPEEASAAGKKGSARYALRQEGGSK